MNDIDVTNKRRLIECFVQEWTDSNMRWDESEYGGVKDIRVPPSSLWKPDILMYNRLDLNFYTDIQSFIMALLPNQTNLR